ncbi:MAG: Dabb family protein [Spirochaetes bacterium]|nr:Dabb family protein [Spirochaetota bacterium]
MNEKNKIYRYVVLFQFNNDISEKTIRKIEKAFRNLCKNLVSVKDYEWGINSSTENLTNGFTHCFIVTFEEEKVRDLYLTHPEHLAFMQNYPDANLKKHTC